MRSNHTPFLPRGCHGIMVRLVFTQQQQMVNGMRLMMSGGRKEFFLWSSASLCRIPSAKCTYIAKLIWSALASGNSRALLASRSRTAAIVALGCHDSRDADGTRLTKKRQWSTSPSTHRSQTNQSCLPACTPPPGHKHRSPNSAPHRLPRRRSWDELGVVCDALLCMNSGL